MFNKSYDFIINIVSRENIKLSSLELDVLNKLKNSTFDLTKADITSFSHEFFISNASITRFSQRLGFSGFTELKYALSNNEETLKYITQDRVKSIVENLEPIDSETAEFIKNLDKLDKIVVIGIGSSGLVANEFLYKMGELGLYKTDYAKEPYKIDMLAQSMNENDLMVCLSLSGEHYNVIRGAKVAKENGAKILSISSRKQSTLGEISDYFVKAPNYSTYGYSVSKIFPMLLCVDCICEIYCALHDSDR